MKINLSPMQQDELITSFFVFLLISFMVFIVYKDLIKPSKMNKFAAIVLCIGLLAAPTAFFVKNLAILISSFT